MINIEDYILLLVDLEYIARVLNNYYIYHLISIIIIISDDKYDLNNWNWIRLCDIEIGRRSASSVLIENDTKIIVIGGVYKDEVELYDIGLHLV